MSTSPVDESSGSGSGSIGPVIAVLVVIVILGVLAVMVGRLCSGKTIFGYGQYDIESWAEAKCSTCIDGTITIPPRPSRDSTPAAVQTHRQDEPDHSPPPPPNVDS